MALISCPGCKKRISEHAEKCPNCGGQFNGSCPECGSARGVREESCSKCGYPFSRKDDAAESVQQTGTNTADPASGPSGEHVRAEHQGPFSLEAPSLAAAFWLYLVLIGRGGSYLLLRVTDSVNSELFWLVMMFIAMYLLWAWHAVWRATGRYVGPAVWRILAKVSVVVDVGLNIFIVALVAAQSLF